MVDRAKRAAVCFLLVTSYGLAQAPAPQTTPPMDEFEILGLLGTEATDEEVASFIRRHGISFQPSNEFLEAVHRAGGGEGILDVLKAAASKLPLSQSPAGHADQTVILHDVALGIASGKLELYDQSAEQYRAALQIDGSNGILYYLLGDSLLHLRQFDAATEAARRAVELQPRFVYGYISLAAALSAKGDRADSLHTLERAMQADPQDVAPAVAMVGWIMASRSPQTEFPEVTSDIKPEPWAAGIYAGMAIALKELGQREMAAALFMKALQLNDNVGGIHSLYGNMLFDEAHFADAEAQFRAVLRLDPADPSGHYDLARALHMDGNEDGSIEQYREAIQLKPNFPEAYNNLGNALDDKHQEEAAAEAFHKALELNPKMAEAHWGLGNTLVARGDIDSGLAEYRKALAIKDMPMVHLSIGKAFILKRQYDEAVREANLYLDAQPDSADGYVFAGLIFAEAGKREASLQAYKKALQIDPNNKAARNALQQLPQGKPN
jgi:tetratricopeptide (TPR) repeat protein